ncbi:MAG: protease inhibitor I42 family protein [Anaerolineae bacterium]|nr:protease inhibitor I42 family protein [Anaerolineae bacterium]
MKKQWVVLCLILIVSLLGGTPTAAQIINPPQSTGIYLDATANGKTVTLNSNEVLAITLESNPSTGYRWQVSPSMDTGILRNLGATEWAPSLQGSNELKLGAPMKQTLRFVGIATGETNLTLEYRRPWEKAEAEKTFSIQVQVIGATSEQQISIMGPSLPPQLAVMAADTGSAISAVPSSYDWCSNNGCTPVKNQGNCGSCWAFGTVGVLESQIRIDDGLTKDLSEQYLVSCNTDGYGCDGGWWAHDYHLSKIPSGEPAAGAVYEIDFPYTATDSSCNPPHTHHEKITNWEYVGSSSGVPATADIKQAIYDYGPVAAAVCVGDAFQDYDGGIFSTNECSTVNHAILLVGWNDTGGYWILRNSWGPNWGESGYMRIAYGTSRVGYAATYVEYEPSGPTPTPTNTPVPSDILLVDDDQGKSYETYYASALAAAGRTYDTWTVSTQGSPSASTLQAHDIVIWLTGDDYSATLSSTDEANLATFLNGGGKLFISGQDIGYDIRTDSFYGSYLHASYVADDTNVYDLTGAGIFSGVNINISGTGGANNQGYPSAVNVAGGGVGIFDYSGSTYTWGGVSTDTGTYKVVYFSFGFEAINSSTTRNTVMSAILTWFGGGSGPTPTYTPTPTRTPTPTPTRTPTPTAPPSGSILLVDDDLGSSYQTYYANALTALGRPFTTWTVSSQGSPSAATLNSYDIVIWLTGNDYSSTLTSTDQTNLAAFLNAGGKLFISGQDIGYDIRTDSFYGSYLHAGYVRDDTNTYSLTGAGIFSGLSVSISGTGGANNQGYPSEVSVSSGGVGLFDYSGSYGWGGVSTDTGTYKVVYLAFGFEAINSSTTRNSVMNAVLTWFN